MREIADGNYECGAANAVVSAIQELNGLEPLGLVESRPFLEVSALTQVLEYLKKHGQRLDTEIAKDTGIALATVRQRIASLRAAGDVITCDLTRFEGGKRTEAWICRVSGYIPPPAPGRKAVPIARAPAA